LLIVRKTTKRFYLINTDPFISKDSIEKRTLWYEDGRRFEYTCKDGIETSTLWDENGQISYKSIYKYGIDTPSQTIVLTRFILSATIEWE
jgi:hypothetical protein